MSGSLEGITTLRTDFTRGIAGIRESRGLSISSCQSSVRRSRTASASQWRIPCSGQFISGVRPINWGRLIQEYVDKSIPHIGQKPSFLSPYILHLYLHYVCINEVEEDALTITEDEVVYKLGPDAEATEPGTEQSSRDHAVPEPPPFVPVPEPKRATTPHPCHDASLSHAQPLRDIHLSNFELPETPFQRVQTEVIHLQNQYFKLEHITRGVSWAFGNCGPENILREVAQVTDRSKIQALDTENAQLAAQVAAMTPASPDGTHPPPEPIL